MTTNLLVYPSTLPGKPLERYAVEGMTLDHWLRTNVDGYAPGDKQPISATVNGVVVEPAQWADTYITADTAVELRPQPQGVETLIVAAVAAAVAVAATLLLKPSIPSQRNKSARGRPIYEVGAEGNRPRLGDVIPEIAGRRKHYPDYLSAPRRYFVEPKVQALDLLLCVGRGEYDLPGDEIRIGETPVGLLGAAVDYQVFAPGESVSGHDAHRRWYNAPEVGATTGGSGIRLLSTSDLQQEWDATLTLSGAAISGADQPASWGEGVIVSVTFDIPVEVSNDVDGDNTFDMDVGYLMPSPGMMLRIQGISGLSRVRIDSINGSVYTLERYELVATDPDLYDWRVIGDITPGSYTASVYDWPLEALHCRVTDSSSDIEVVMQRNGEDVAGWPGFPASTSNVAATLDEGQRVGIWSNAFLACPPGETTSRLEWDVFAPSGLGYIKDNGDIESRSRALELQYRRAGTETWTTVSEGISGRTRDQLGWTFVVDLPSAMTPEVRLRRASAEDNSTQALDRLEWYGLRSELPGAKSSYPGVTVLAMTITGSSEIANQAENQVNVVATRKLPTRSGGAWTAPQATRDIVPWLAYVAKSVGYTDADLDLDEMDRLDAIWQGRGDRFDFIEADDSTVKESLNRVMRAGMAELTIDAGRLSPRRDELRATFEHMYTPQNMLEPLGRSVQAPRPDDPDGVDVEYIDAESWTEEVVECRLPGDAGIRPEKVTLEGVTDRTRAWRIGMRRRRELKYRCWEYSFSTELDALNSRYLSYCAVGDDVPGYGQSALIKSVSGTTLELSEPVPDDATVLAWRRPDGTLSGPWPITSSAGFSAIVDATELPVVDWKKELPHALFGATERWSFPVLITSIQPRGFDRVQVQAANYDERIYSDDDNTPPA